MSKHLIGLKNSLSEEGNQFVTKDRIYKVIEEDDMKFIIIDDEGMENHLSKSPYKDNYFRKWFDNATPYEASKDKNELIDVIVELKSLNYVIDSFRLNEIIEKLVEINKTI